MEDIILKCERIEKKYSKTKALDNINLSIYTGHIYALIGENGAGKTTLMRIISGLIGSDNGKMELKSKNIGALIEKPAFYPGLTAKENIKIISLMRSTLIEKEIVELAMKFGIWENHKKVKNYSLGMKQKLDIILALIGKPQLLVLDEPLNGLDPKSTIQIRKLLSDLREKGITILISSHILDELFRVATDYIFISQGTIKKNFTYEEIVHKYPDKMPEEIYLDILEE